MPWLNAASRLTPGGEHGRNIAVAGRIKECLEIAGSIANFAGGAILLIDALRVAKVIRIKKASKDFLAELRAAGVAELDLPVDPNGKPLHSAEEVELWLSEGGLKRSWWGFVLLLVGFGCELLSHASEFLSHLF